MQNGEAETRGTTPLEWRGRAGCKAGARRQTRRSTPGGCLPVPTMRGLAGAAPLPCNARAFCRSHSPRLQPLRAVHCLNHECFHRACSTPESPLKGYANRAGAPRFHAKAGAGGIPFQAARCETAAWRPGLLRRATMPILAFPSSGARAQGHNGRGSRRVCRQARRRESEPGFVRR